MYTYTYPACETHVYIYVYILNTGKILPAIPQLIIPFKTALTEGFVDAGIVLVVLKVL